MANNYVQQMIDRINQELPGLEPELAELYALLGLVLGDRVSPRDVHDAWAIWRNRTKPDHRSLVPFEELSLDVQELDQKYVEGFRRAATSIKTAEPGTWSAPAFRWPS